MQAGTASDEVTDFIALIEMHRQEAQKESGLAAACGEALRKLHELLAREKEELRVSESNELHGANITAVTNEIQRVQKLADAKKSASGFQRGRTRPQQVPRPSTPRNPARNKGRRTMGRRGDR